MKIIITAATEGELSILKNQIANKPNSNHIIHFAVTGIGITATTYNLTKILANSKYDLVVNIGIAGSFNNKYPIGTVTAVECELFADFGIKNSAEFQTIFEANLLDKNSPPFNKGKLHCPYIDQYTNLEKVTSATVNTVSGDTNQINSLQSKFQPDIESMEGAAFFYVCLLEKIPFIEIRSISNIVEQRDKSKWNIPLAIKNANDWCYEFINTIDS